MGAWGVGAFENDDASDWVFELEDAADPSAFLVQTFAGVTDAAAFDAREASRVVAAAAWLVSSLPAGKTVPREAMPTIGVPAITPQIRDAAIGALGQVLQPGSEWRELWDDAGEDEPVTATERLLTILRLSAED